jgi:hypothetical protein
MSLPKEIYESLMNEPARWRLTNNRWTIRRDDGVEIWCSHRDFGLGLYRPTEIRFPRRWRKKIWKAIESRWKRTTIANLLE